MTGFASKRKAARAEQKIGCVNHDCDQCQAQQEQECLVALGWQEIDCPICGGGARAFPKPEQEPVAWMDVHQPWDLYKNKPQLDAIPLYTAPPKRPWVDLMRGVRVNGEQVIVTVKGGNEAARALCGELVKEMNA